MPDYIQKFLKFKVPDKKELLKAVESILNI